LSKTIAKTNSQNLGETMKNLRKQAAVVILTLALCLCAFAGQIPTIPEAPPPPPGETHGPGMPSTAPGQMPTPPEADSQTSFSEFAVSVLESILPLL
jgi:hypothetical protein